MPEVGRRALGRRGERGDVVGADVSLDQREERPPWEAPARDPA